MSGGENTRYIVQVFVGDLSDHYEALSVEAGKQTTSEEIVLCIVDRLSLADPSGAGAYELAEVVGDSTVGQECKERRLGPSECPVALMMLWPQVKHSCQEFYRFYLREKLSDVLWPESFAMDPQLIRDYFYRFLYQPKDREYPDLCQLPELDERTLLDNLKDRFNAGHIYTYVGSILIAVNPFKFHPIYNPKYVKLYQNRRLGPDLPPHIFAVADAAYHCMLKDRRNQCVVISGESGSGKTESTNFLLHHLTALSQKGSHGSGVEQTILSAGPVLEAFGNAKTAHNNNSSRFGKFIQVNYKENGMVHGAVVQKYLLEKSRICSHGRNERNYHVFYYLLAGASDSERQLLHLLKPTEYNYLSRSACVNPETAIDERHEFSRLKQSMEMVGFTAEKQRRLFSVLSSVLLLGNVEFQPRKSAAYHHDEAVAVKNPQVVALISELLRVKQETLLQALTAKRARASGETLVINYRLPEAIAARDAMAKCLYGALFDWIVLQVNHALLAKKDSLREHQGNSIGVLDIFGFEDFGLCNSFEQFCINYANEHLQYYFNQHVFRYEQEEYRKEGIRWTDIEFMDNTGCLHLIEGKPSGLLCMLDDQCNFPGATNETLLQKFNSVHKDNLFYEIPQRRENAFIVRHYAGKVKYQVNEFREKNLDLMRQDIVGVLKNSSMAFVRELVGADPVAVFRWAIVRAFFRGYFAFHEAGRKHRLGRDGTKTSALQTRFRNHIPNENLISPGKTRIYYKQRSVNESPSSPTTNHSNEPLGRSSRLSWPQIQNTETTTHVPASRYKSSKPDFLQPPSPPNRVALDPDEARVLERASQIVMKNKSFRPRERAKKGLKNLQTVKTLAGRTQSLGLPLGNKARKQPLTVTAQFQHSLHSLMDTLGHADPFFIRCIKSNAHKIPNEFDEDTVQRQLRYTGMLETVRIRQAGYNVRLTYDEFIQMYRILLPRGLISSQIDVRNFLLTLNLNRDHYQLGTTKIFLRESEKEKLDVRLHQQIMSSIVTLQRWTRTFLERRRYERWRTAATKIQTWWRTILAQKAKQRAEAAVRIQTWWRCHHQRKYFLHFREALINFQAHAKGTLLRRKISEARAARARVAETTSAMSTDEAFQSKESSQEELDQRTGRVIHIPPRSSSNRPLRSELHDSDESGIQEDSDIEFRRIEEIPENSRGVINRSRRLHPSISTIEPGTCFGGLSERKGSSDSLTSQRSLESQRSVGVTGDGAPVRDTLNKAKRQFQAFMGISSGRREKSVDPHTAASLAAAAAATLPSTTITHSDSESEDVLQTSPIAPSVKPPLTRSYPVKPKIADPEVEPEAPIRIARRQRGSREHCRSLASEDSLSHVDGSGVSTNLATIREAAWVSRSTDNANDACVPPSLHVHDITKKRSRSGAITTLELKRRNSDPAAAKSLSGLNISSISVTGDIPGSIVSEALQWKGTTTFTIAGHSFRKVNKFSKDDQCAFCNKLMDSLVTQGHKCSECKQLFHTKCIQNGGVLHKPCQHSGSNASGGGLGHGAIGGSGNSSGGGGARRKHRKHSRAPHDMAKPPATGKFSLTGTSEFTDSTDKIISDATELEMMQDFITKKIYKMEEGNKKPSEVDRVFKQALREFKDNLVSTYSVMNKQGTSLNIKYKDLIANFLYVMETVCNQEKTGEDFPVTMGVNAFRGFMNEFMNLTRLEEKPTKTKRKKEKKRKLEDPIHHGGHTFVLTIINIPTACEMCNSFFMWPIERGLVCQNCKLTCHKKCYSKVLVACAKETNDSNSSLAPDTGKRVFGVPLHQLASGDGKIPLVVDRLITTIEIYGLYTEGIYRKSGVSSKVKELKARLEETGCEGVNFGDYQVHVLAAVLKSFLREMPEPLLTFDSYEDFLRAANLTDPKDRVATIFGNLKKLPKPNFDLMERLIFHLARVALHEDANRMNASALAIVFAPCVLRTNKPVPAQDSLLDISRQTQCIETIVSEQLRKVRSTLADIDTLDTACHTATHRLSSLRSSKIFSPEELLPAAEKAGTPEAEDEEEVLLIGHIQEIQKEKALLTSTLPSLTRTTSDDDLLSTDDGSLDDVTGRADEESQTRKTRRSVVSRSVSGGDDDVLITSARNPGSIEDPFPLRSTASGSINTTFTKGKLKRQSSSDNSVVSLYPPIETECDEDPIMV